MVHRLQQQILVAQLKMKRSNENKNNNKNNEDNENLDGGKSEESLVEKNGKLTGSSKQ